MIIFVDFFWKRDAMRRRTFYIFGVLCFVAIGMASATTYDLPENPDDNIISQYSGNSAFIRVEQDETLLDIALRFSLGQTEIVRLNQKVDRWLVKTGVTVRLANRRILPDTPRKGITLNLSEYRIYYYPNVEPGMPAQVMSYAPESAEWIGKHRWAGPGL